MATKVYCEWTYGNGFFDSVDFNGIFDEIQRITLEKFAGDPVKGTYSSSVQATLYNIGNDVLSKFAAIKSISFVLCSIACSLLILSETSQHSLLRR